MGNDSGKQSKKGQKVGSRKSKADKALSIKDIPEGKLAHDPTHDINLYYDITNQVLGVGSFSTVKAGISKETGVRVAVKIVDKNLVKHKPEMLKNEVEILLAIQHPNVIHLYDLFDTSEHLYMVMELVTGGELFERIVEREQYSEEDAKEVMRQLFDAIEYIHSKNIVHRDLKPENLLLEDDADDTRIKLTDFGLSRIYDSPYMSTSCGTAGYIAPEILKASGYGPAVDMWSCGVIMYILLCGYPPFYNENDAILFESIMEAKYRFHTPYWDLVSSEAKDLIKSLLVVEPEKRLTATAAKEALWFKKTDDNRSNPLPPDLKEQLKRHNTNRKSCIQVEVSAKRKEN